MITGLFRLLLVLGAILLARRIVMGLFGRSGSGGGDRMRNPHPKKSPRSSTAPEDKTVGPQQPIEEADYEDLD